MKSIKSVSDLLQVNSVVKFDYRKLTRVECVGEGSTGYVDKMVSQDNQYYAVKFFKYSSVSKIAAHSLKQQFAMESSIMFQIKHPCITQIKGIWTKIEDPSIIGAITMEYIENGSLRDMLDKHSPELNDYKTKMQIAFGIAKGMLELHKNHIIHRDLKLPKISDFGLSKQLFDESYTKTGNIGTVQYMAPEVSEGQEYTSKVDVFSYGMILYELYTQKALFQGMNPFQIVMAVSQGHRPTIPSIISSFEAELIQKCWSQNPEERPSFEDIVQMFEQNEYCSGLFRYVADTIHVHELLMNQTPLQLAQKVVDYENKIRDLQNRKKVKSIFDASRMGYIDIVEEMLKQTPKLVSKHDSLGNTPLHYAAENDHKDIVLLLLSQKAKIDKVNAQKVYFRLLYK